MTDELKPCAHCSSAEVEGMDTGRVGDRKYFVGCWRCHAQSGLYATPREAITAWNRRACHIGIACAAIKAMEGENTND